MHLSERRVIHLTPPQILMAVFGFFIVLGTFFLKLPFASTETVSWLDAFFTATSAMTVTGLVTVDTGTAYTLVGQIVILLLIQIGGLGIMSFAVLIYIMLGRKIGISERLLIQQALNQTSVGGIIQLVKSLMVFSLVMEGIAVVFLAFRWVPEYGVAKGLYYSLFHSISAFNNAGFALWPDGLNRFVSDPIINSVISMLFILGGIGFTVLIDLKKSKTFKELTLHSKLMIVGTIVINAVAFILILLFEYNNTATLGKLSVAGKIWGAYFQAVSPRTAGFNSVDIGSMEEPSIFFMIFLMFIGAGSASTGGGIKLTTFLAMVLSVITFLKGRDNIIIFRKTLPLLIIIKALAITVISFLFIFAAVMALELTQDLDFLPILFEVVSAFGTVGLSMGITAKLTFFGKIVIIFIMFLGKIGPLTLAFAFAKKENSKIRYPKEDILTG
ncbi:Ktr system potassium transporter B [Pseudalkalibacillus caeni]|uniref:Ktr system potassium transporter B n=2 Tax=Exobacillus caeni TaxID=2574798 RepID=A0A5R9F729_9BACL|nr:TrkH family potassium uptake protein [Pseudalkalibacillus caeni]TLS38319.1 Ktr system potassium transporter B [Pseudalkalibacillus caeni]